MKHEKNGSLTFYENNSKSAFNWETLARYHLNHQDWLSLSLSDRTRFPTLKERYTTMKPAMNQIALVNPQLKAERAQNIALTWSGHINGSWRYETSIWYNRVSDAIVSKSISDRLTQNQNSGRINYSGVDIGINGSPLDMLDVGASYGLIHADIKSREAGKPTGQPTQTLTSWLTFRPLDSLRFTLSEEARSSSYSNSSGTQKAAGFAVTHLRADYNVGYGISVNASVNNLFDSKYALSEGFIEEGRNVWAGIEYKF
jgi:iron complex outermembrane receptor protein